MRKPRSICAVMAFGLVVALSACSDPDRVPDLREVRSVGGGPEEFGVVPNKPLEMPEDFAELPVPNPSGQNRSAQRPLEDAIIALGGTPVRSTRSGTVPAGDAALVQQTSRFGRDPAIRTTLAEEDLDFRQRRSLFTWQLFPDDDYTKAYRPQQLDPFAEVNDLRRAGVRAPTAPPRELAR